MTDALDSIVDETLVDGDTSTRRTVLRGMAVVGVVAGTPMLAVACGDGGEGDTTDTSDGGDTQSNEDEGTNEDEGSGDEGSEDTGDDDGGDTEGGGAIAQTSEIEVGGGTIFADEEIIITQPEDGTFVGLTSLCSHKGCPLSDITDGTINCASECGHGSQFDLEGAVTNGPATAPLAEVALQVDGENITRA